jgi:two-component system osmolarity sensor histidine kinase EnvZ
MTRSLASQNARLLVGVFLIFELLVASAVVVFLMLPMARSSAADLASLMLLSAQTWSELPPETRPAFEHELAATHQLALRAEPPAYDRDEWHGPYLHFVEASLAARTGRMPPGAGGDRRGGVAVDRPALRRAQHLGGFSLKRVDAHPLLTLLVSLALGFALALLTARWLASRTVAPLERLEQAAARLGRGETPELLDETGPAELATLARRFNRMARQVRDLLTARTTLLAGLSHDLRTPLARMRLAIGLLEEHPSARALTQLERDVAEMDRLIGNVLDLARGLEGEAAVKLDLCALLHELAAECRSPGRVNRTRPGAVGSRTAARPAPGPRQPARKRPALQRRATLST